MVQMNMASIGVTFYHSNFGVKHFFVLHTHNPRNELIEKSDTLLTTMNSFLCVSVFSNDQSLMIIV